ncbi:MAG: hypothetical protein KA007_00795 [Candidatus Pacebacteria bacterium]|nr:hypothetical protein [Candidatus Paceibacterota bacterium]
MRKIRNFLIPHEENGHVPHIFSEKVCIGLVAFVVFIYGTSLISTLSIRTNEQVGAVYGSILVDMTNKARAESDLPTLKINPVLVKAAEEKAKDMVENSYFAHTSPNGITPWFWFSDVGYKFSYAGENLAVGFNESAQVHSGWINSPTHKANILSANFTEIGIAVADGYHKGKPATFVVQMFGKPKTTKAPVVTLDTTTTNEAPSNNLVTTVLSATAEKVPIEITTVFEDKYLSIAKDESAEDVGSTVPDENTAVNSEASNVELSTKKDRALASQPLLVQYIFTIVMILSLFSLIAFLLMEFKARHMKHALYGLILLTITAGLSFANEALIVVPELFY